MAVAGPNSRLSQLWQFPLLLISVAMFAVAAYLFIGPQAGPTIDEKIGVARRYLEASRPEASIEQLNKILATEKLDLPHQGQVNLMLAESIESAQRLLKINIPRNHRQIIERTRMAVANGMTLDANDFRRLGESYESLSRPMEALENYRKAIAMDAERSLFLRRKVIQLLLEHDDLGPAEASLDEYLAQQAITDSERAWALGLKAQMLIDQAKFIDARILLDDALRLARDTLTQGEVNYRLGYCAYKLNDLNEAERYLRVSRDQLQIGHPLDAEACYWLGRVHQDRAEPDPAVAISFYQIVLTSHIDSKIMPLAMLGRGLCRIMLRQEEAGLSDLQDLVNEITRKTSRAKLKDTAIEGLRTASSLLAARESYQGALEVLANEHVLEPIPQGEFFERLGAVYERRADQLERSLPTIAPTERSKREIQVRQFRTNAGDAYVAYSQKLTLADDVGYGDAMWHGIELYDRASALQHAISALETFSNERPEDPLAPDATFRLGRAYQAAGQYDKAISAYQRIQIRYSQSLARTKSAVPLAQAYVAKGPAHYGKAEMVLLSVLNDNPRLSPEAEEFKQSLFDLAKLYYNTRRYEEAVQKLEEFVQRYPGDPRMGQLRFLMADSYRQSAELLDARLASAKTDPTKPMPVAAESVEATAARRQRLEKAGQMFARVIEHYQNTPPRTDLDKLYLKHAHFYYADCMYDIADYQQAVRLYGTAASRYQDDPSALAAYVQIVNAYCAMGQFEEAKTANERAKILAARIPADAFENGTFAMPKTYWQTWLQWTSAAGMW